MVYGNAVLFVLPHTNSLSLYLFYILPMFSGKVHRLRKMMLAVHESIKCVFQGCEVLRRRILMC